MSPKKGPRERKPARKRKGTGIKAAIKRFMSKESLPVEASKERESQALPLGPVLGEAPGEASDPYAGTMGVTVNLPPGTDAPRTLLPVEPGADARELVKHAFILKFVVEYRCSQCGMIFKVPLHKKVTGGTYGPPPDVRDAFEKHVCPS